MHVSLLRGSFVCAFAAAFAGAAAAQDGGPPFQVNTFTSNYQQAPAIATDASGAFVIGWESQTQDGADDGVIARAFEAAGAPRTNEVAGNFLTTLGPQFETAVAVQPDGGFFLVWTDGFPAAQNVWLRRFTAAGLPLLGTELQVNPPLTFGDQRGATIDADASGHAVVVWASQNGFASANWTIFAKRFSAAGLPLSGDLQVSQGTTGLQDRPVVAMDPQGNFVVTWHAAGRDGSGNAVLARLFAADGSPLGNEFLVNVTTGGNQQQPWVDRDAGGRFVIAWQSEGQDGSSWGVYARRFEASGAAAGGEFRANTVTFERQERPMVALGPDGRFIIVWQSGGQEGTPDYGVYGQRYDPAGAPVGTEFHANTTTAGHQYQPAVAVQPGGGFVVTWAQQQTGTLFTDVWARIYPAFGSTSDLIFADGFETGDLSRWSSAATDGGDLAVTQPAALSGTFGLQATVDDTASVFAQDGTPADEPRYRARFKFDPHTFDPGEANGSFRTRIFIAFEEAPQRRLVAMVLRRTAGNYAVMARVRQDDGSLRDTGFLPISGAPHSIEFDWVKASAPSAFDGRFEMWIDGVSRSALTGLDTFDHTVDMSRMGALSVKGGAAGTLYFDAFDSRRSSYIGPAN